MVCGPFIFLIQIMSLRTFIMCANFSDKSFGPFIRDIHIECSKQFKLNVYFYVSGQSGPFWAVLKLP